MFKLKSAIIALVVLVISASAVSMFTPLVGQGQGNGQNAKTPRKFYLTPTEHDGSQALSACAAGYHMASLWEIHEPSNLRYDTDLGATLDDSGFGPPALPGLVRTGGDAIFTFGRPNCRAWTRNSANDSGTIANLNFDLPTEVSPWRVSSSVCSTPHSCASGLKRVCEASVDKAIKGEESCYRKLAAQTFMASAFVVMVISWVLVSLTSKPTVQSETFQPGTKVPNDFKSDYGKLR